MPNKNKIIIMKKYIKKVYLGLVAKFFGSRTSREGGKFWKGLSKKVGSGVDLVRRKKSKILVGMGVVLVIFGGAYIAVHAQEIIDSFTSSSSVADTWNVEVDTTAGEVKLEARACDDTDWFCGTGYDDVCANTLGDGDYIVVAKTDIATTQQWKNENTACDQPQCGIDGGQNGDELTADNTVNFANYPARQVCKALGGRLPTKTELSCIYTNKASFGDNFGTGNYWSGTEPNAAYAWYVRFSGGAVSHYSKTHSSSVRCVLGW